jgi:hypothetical protein
MEPRPAVLPDLSTIETAEIAGYTVDPDGRTVRLWINRQVDAEGPVRVFVSEAKHEVHVVVVPTPMEYGIGYCGDWSEAEMQADVADVVARLAAPIGGRRIVDGKSGRPVPALPQWILDRRSADPAPAQRPIGNGSLNDPLTFRGEL